jgi:nitrite reductase/ring-hydroxylating ferredoxin subunit
LDNAIKEVEVNTLLCVFYVPFILKETSDIMDYIRLATVKDFDNKNIISFSIAGKKIGLIKRQDGSIYAIEVGCKHQGADLTKGEVSGTIATCYRHQWKYDLESGKCLNHDSPDLRKHDVRIDGEDIYVSFQPLL